jgi:hypothetical protein
MHTVTEPTAEEFFASATGVCVYVNIRGRALRVQFETPDGPGLAQGTTDVGANEALAAASRALEKHKDQLRPLFERVARELAKRS